MKKPRLNKLIAFQLCFCFVLCTLTSAWSGLDAAFSAAVGGLVIVLSNGAFYRRLFVMELGTDSSQVLGNYYRAEVVKLSIVAVMIATVLVVNRHAVQPLWFDLEVTALFFGFLAQSIFVTITNARFIARWLRLEFPDVAVEQNS